MGFTYKVKKACAVHLPGREQQVEHFQAIFRLVALVLQNDAKNHARGIVHAQCGQVDR